jgi:hypothetical protein
MSTPYGELAVELKQAREYIRELEKRAQQEMVGDALAQIAKRESDAAKAEASRVEQERIDAWKAHGVKGYPVGWPRGEGPSAAPEPDVPEDISGTLLGKAVQ